MHFVRRVVWGILAMWRAFFLSIGIVLCVLGIEFLVCDHFVVAKDGFLGRGGDPSASGALGDYAYDLVDTVAEPRKIVPPEWAPWSFLSSGAIVLLYSIVSPRGGD